MAERYDRAAENVGNIVALEHVNLLVPDQRLATLFYITGMGLTRDPYLVTGVTNMWVNVGRSQFHLPTRGTQVLRGHIGLVLPDLDALARRLETVRDELEGTRFGFVAGESGIDVTCPWGNRLRCYAPDPRFGPIALGLPYVAFDVPVGAAEGIARFYREILWARAAVEDTGGAPVARVSVGYRQELIFRETDTPLPDYDGHHIQLYIANFCSMRSAHVHTQRFFSYRFCMAVLGIFHQLSIGIVFKVSFFFFDIPKRQRLRSFATIPIYRYRFCSCFIRQQMNVLNILSCRAVW